MLNPHKCDAENLRYMMQKMDLNMYRNFCLGSLGMQLQLAILDYFRNFDEKKQGQMLSSLPPSLNPEPCDSKLEVKDSQNPPKTPIFCAGSWMFNSNNNNVSLVLFSENNVAGRLFIFYFFESNAYKNVVSFFSEISDFFFSQQPINKQNGDR